MQKFTIGNEIFEYNIQRGKVIQINGNTSTSISSNKGTDGSIVGISSTIHNHQDIYLEDESGKQFVVNLNNWNISAINGHKLSFIWLQNRFNQNYAYIYNETLDNWRYCNFDSYFEKHEGTGGCLILLFGIGASCIIPPFLYSNDNTTFPWILFFIMIATTIILFAKYASKNKQSEKFAKQLKEKMEEIFNTQLRHFQ